MKYALSIAFLCGLVSLNALPANAQNKAPKAKAAGKAKAKAAGGGGTGLSLSPSRLELKMLPGSSKTFVVRVMHGKKGFKGKKARLLARLNDWTLSPDGRVKYHKPSTVKNSAAPWIAYSPSEMAVPAGGAHSVRVTVTVPKNAKPGDHATALIIQPRPGSLKRMTNQKRMVFRFRLASILYIQVPPLKPKPSLTGLKAIATKTQILVTSTLRNAGNSLVRPRHSVKILEGAGKLVAKHEGADMMPLLAGKTLRAQLVIKKALPAGAYAVRYRIDFRNRGAVVEGRTKLIVP